MARVKNNLYTINQELKRMDSRGQSKHEDKIKTNNERYALKQRGFDLATREKMCNYGKDKIYSNGTMTTYRREGHKFADWLNDTFQRKFTLEQMAEKVPEYVKYLKSYRKSNGEPYSAYTIHKKVAAVCKITHTYMRDYDLPKRELSNITKGKHEVKNDKYNERNNADILAQNRLLGMRRTAFANVKVKDVRDFDDRTVVCSIGKGGRKNMQVFIRPEERAAVLKFCEGKSPNDYLFDKKRILKSDCDLHSERANRAKDVYNYVVEDMKNNPERREFYRDFVMCDLFENGKNMPENLDKPYYCRGKFRQMLIEQGKPYVFDRLAAQFVSLTVLNHWRVDTSIENYIAK
jgi:hypothetical protein